jgi:L-fucose isomerase-like protein
VLLGKRLPETDGVIFPQMLGEAYRELDKIKKLPQPLMIVTSEFGTVSMWDWEINSYLTAKGIKVIGPTNLEKTKQVCRAFALKRQLRHSKLLVFQDNPASGGGNQDEIFKRFYWWEPECIQAIEKKYGVKVVKKSFRKLGQDAKAISDEMAQKVWNQRKAKTPVGKITSRAILSAVKIYMAVKRELDQDPDVIAVGINCLNESMFSETTPCLAWNLLFEDQRMVWGCEADLVSMLTKVLISKTLEVPFMMTNLYPFQMGDAALKHEHIPNFPDVEGASENYILAAHCGYFGVVPQSFSTEWKLKKKVLAIVDDNATAIDARLPEGDITLVKLLPPFDRWSVVEGDLPKYAQFKNSHCLNGAVIRVPDGKRLVDDLVSHHYIITTGHNLNELEMVSKVFGLECSTI